MDSLLKTGILCCRLWCQSFYQGIIICSEKRLKFNSNLFHKKKNFSLQLWFMSKNFVFRYNHASIKEVVSVWWSVCLLIHPSVPPSVHPSVFPSVRPSVPPSVRLSLPPSFGLSVGPSVGPSVGLSRVLRPKISFFV